MPSQPSTTESFKRTRSDHASETAEDYVEAIAEIAESNGRCRVVDLAKKFAVSHVTVTKIIKRLEVEGLVQTERYGPMELTVDGKKMAANARQRHEVVYRFLISIGVDAKTAALDAEGIEHHVSQKTLAKMQAFVESKPKK